MQAPAPVTREAPHRASCRPAHPPAHAPALLQKVPLDSAVRKHSDEGVPVVVAAPESTSAAAYIQIAGRVWDKLRRADEEAAAQRRGAAGDGGGGGGGPKITVG